MTITIEIHTEPNGDFAGHISKILQRAGAEITTLVDHFKAGRAGGVPVRSAVSDDRYNATIDIRPDQR
jgi:hypothetical protein